MASKVDPAVAQKLKGVRLAPAEVDYTKRDVILYNIGIGAKEMQYVYENSTSFSVIPTYAAVFRQKGTSYDATLFGAELFRQLPVPINPAMIVHGEQYVEILKPLPISGRFQIQTQVLNFFDKGKGALLELEETTVDSKGEPICKSVSGIYIRGLGGFGGERGPSREKENLPPQRAPDAVHEDTTLENQAHIYRLSGDYNPLHIDNDMAQMVGFPKPILHGLCTYGFACRAVLKHFCNDDPAKLKSFRARFANPVFPGDTLVTEMWKEPNGIVFQMKVKSSGKVVIANALATISGGGAATSAPVSASVPSSSSSSQLQSAAIFEGIGAQIKSNPAVIKKINAVYQFNIKATDGSVVVYTVDVKNQASAGVYKDKKATSPDCTITIADADYYAMATGSLNPMAAFTSGKLSVEGNVMLAQKLSLLTENGRAKL